MRILQINNFHYLRGGDCRYTFDLAHLLEKHGHKVVHFSMHHPRNEPYAYDRFFISHIDYAELNKQRSLHSTYRVITTVFWNREAQRNLAALLREFKPDIAHLQNIQHHITPSVILLLSKHGIPIIHHLHDYNLICPNEYLWRDGKICEECFGGRYYRCVLHRCKRGSLPASILAATQRYFHKAIDAFRGISYFITPSEFAKQKLERAGFFARDHLVCIPNFVDCENIKPDWHYEKTQGVVFVGRLIAEKGVWTLLKAAEQVPDIPIVIVGDGDLRGALEEEARRKGLENLRFEGWQPRDVVFQKLRDACALVMPSEWYETMGISILESGAIGRAAIVSNNTAMGEVVQHKTSGLVFPMGNADALAACIKQICSDVSLAEKLGRGARTRIEQVYSVETHYRQITKLYNQAIEGKSLYGMQRHHNLFL